ncbi:hypothetical protein FOA43_002595 [Brettanomyces nanus]|uniref:Uncharacterized protein n=1 Tax=Eeniella nana TaxID=13502 RepID=A0A875S4E7_EENNA|nr:uncharacterized protein FOA43_002595 [Brettanomyces nanus]QPG75245.1 hypothetical protein FOA43_002595 [Brettanomyces nanus]
MTTTTNFSLVEQNKENIQAIPQGRSVKRLVDLEQLHGTELKEKLAAERELFEVRLDRSQLEDLDDPLEPYLDYLKWIRESFPSGNNNRELIKLLEKATHDFKDDDYYKNEVRYFKIWLEYIKFSDTPREIFTYLFKKQIGRKLSLFYESYAGFMEEQDDYERADEIYKMGIECKARPAVKLQNAYERFKIRLKSRPNQEESSKEVRVLSNSEGGGLSTCIQHTIQKPKFQVFKDSSADTHTSAFNNERSDTRDSLESLQNIRKENKVQGVPFKSQKIPQIALKGARKRKFSVFKDTPKLKYPVTTSVDVPGKRTAKYDFNFDLFFPKEGDTRTLYEVLALMMKKPTHDASFQTPLRKKIRTSMTPASRLGSSFLIGSLNEEEDTTRLTRSPTLTFFSNEARKEILQMFNQPIRSPSSTTTLTNITGTEVGLSDFITETLVKPSTPKKELISAGQETVMSSPFVDTPLRISFEKAAAESSQMAGLSEPSHYPGFHSYNIPLNKSQILKDLLKPGMPAVMGNKQLMIRFGMELFCVIKVLRENDDDSLYLCEQSTGDQFSLRVSQRENDNGHEFCILSELSKRTDLFISSYGYYRYEDESYLMLPYFKQGSLVDLMKCVKLTESLVAFVTLQLLEQMIELHSIGYVHCQIEAGNCMLSMKDSAKYSEVKLCEFRKVVCVSDSISARSQYSQDCFALANVIHRLIFKKPLDIKKITLETVLVADIPSDWQRTTWNGLFKHLLNFEHLDKDGDSVRQLQKVSEMIAKWLKTVHDLDSTISYVASQLNSRSRR